MAKYVYYNMNPKQLHTNDCMVRALAYFFGVTWRKAFLDIIEWCANRGWVDWNYRSKYYIYLSERGFERHKAPEKDMTVGKFCDEFAKEGKVYMVQVKRHMTIIDNKEINDTWDCSESVVENYWVR
jgi:hypothetical protein